MSHPDELPDFFLDRSLGRVQVPTLLRASGLRVISLAEHYGLPADEVVTDAEWLQLVGERRWLAFMKDDKIRYRSAEKQALVEHGVRAFVITNAQLSATEMAERIVSALPRIVEVCGEHDGPFLYALHVNRIAEINLT